MLLKAHPTGFMSSPKVSAPCSQVRYVKNLDISLKANYISYRTIGPHELRLKYVRGFSTSPSWSAGGYRINKFCICEAEKPTPQSLRYFGEQQYAGDSEMYYPSEQPLIATFTQDGEPIQTAQYAGQQQFAGDSEMYYWSEQPLIATYTRDEEPVQTAHYYGQQQYAGDSEMYKQAVPPEYATFTQNEEPIQTLQYSGQQQYADDSEMYKQAVS